jgi:glucose/arabinose dehydrogenase
VLPLVEAARTRNDAPTRTNATNDRIPVDWRAWMRSGGQRTIVGMALTGALLATAAVAAPGAQARSAGNSARSVAEAPAPALTVQTVIARSPGLRAPIGLEASSDGRLWVLEQVRGTVRIVKNDKLLTPPFVKLSGLVTGHSRGLMSIALAPGFPATPQVYLMYTTTVTVGGVSQIVNRVSRFTADGDLAVPGSEKVIWQSLPLETKAEHLGGAMWFGRDAKLYITTGDRLRGPNSQSLTTTWGKILRLNQDGTIPADNPFLGQTSGPNQAIWALGLRNPWQAATREDGLTFISDVGANTWEEVDRAARAANYGWNTNEGPTTAPGFTGPVFAYQHNPECAITGGDFYQPTVAQWPAAFRGMLFVPDFCAGWLKAVNVTTGVVVGTVITGLDQPVDTVVGSQGQVYVITRALGGMVGGALIRLDFA